MTGRHEHTDGDSDDSDHDHDHDGGLAFDVATLLSRRHALALLGGAGLASLAACRTGSDKASTASSAPATSAASPASSSAAASSSSAGSSAAAPSSSASAAPSSAASSAAAAVPSAAAVTEKIPEETAGPYPGDGSNGVNVLNESGIVRSDITTSFGTGAATAAGVPLTMTLKVIDLGGGAVPLAGAAVYLWHCDRDGRYSLYSDGVTRENYLRGVQEANADGVVTFTSVFPGAYSGRWPHAHFEVYRSLAAATSGGQKLRTSQLALPEDVCRLVYGTPGYEASVDRLGATPLDRDGVFRDGYSLQMAAMTGSVASGLTATLNVPV